MIRLMPGHACLREPQLVGLVIRQVGGYGPVGEELVSQEDVARAMRGETVRIRGGFLTVTPPVDAVREDGDDG